MQGFIFLMYFFFLIFHAAKEKSTGCTALFLTRIPWLLRSPAEGMV